MAFGGPHGLYWRSHPVFIIATVAVALFSDLFLYGIIVPVMPFVLQDRVGLPQDKIQSTTSSLLTAYALASVLFSPPAGVLSDRMKTRQLPFLSGLVALSISTLLLFLGRSVPVLVIARLLQGVSGAVCWTSGLALILDTVGPNQLGKVMGTIFSIISVGELAAPVIGGVLYETAGYLAVFAVSFAVLAVDIIMRVLLVEKKVALTYSDVDTAYKKADRQTESTTTDGSEEQDASPAEPLLPPEEAEAYKIRAEKKGLRQFFPILYCFDSRLVCAMFIAFVQAFLLAVFDATLPLQVKVQFNFSTLKAGLSFIPLQVPYLLLGPVAGYFVDRYGPRPVAVAGFGWLVPALILLRVPDGGGTVQVVIFAVILALCGVGMATIGSPAIVEASDVTQKYHVANPDFFGDKGPYGSLYAIQSMVFSLGLSLGPLTGYLRTSIGYGNMNLVVAILCALTATLAHIFIGRKRK